MRKAFNKLFKSEKSDGNKETKSDGEDINHPIDGEGWKNDGNKETKSDGGDINRPIDEHGFTKLHYATSQLAEAKDLVRSGARTDIQTDMGRTPLMFAAEDGHDDIVSFLVESGASLDVRDKYGETAVSAAAYKGYLNIVKVLCQQGADVNISDEEGKSPVIRAAERDHYDIVATLLQYGAEFSDEISVPKLMYAACESGDIQPLKLAISKGANVNMKNDDGVTPISLAVEKRNYGIAATLLKSGAEFNEEISAENLLLYGACEIGDIDQVKLSISKGANINQEDRNGVTAVYLAAKNAKYSLVKYLCENGADASISDGKGFSILRQPSVDGEIEIVELLLSKGAAVDESDENGLTPIYHAAVNKHYELMEMLCDDYGADPNIVDVSGLLKGSKYADEYHQIVRFLLSKGVAPDKSDEMGLTPIYHAAVNKHYEIMKILCEFGADPKILDEKMDASILFRISNEADELDQLVKLLLSKGIAPDKSDEKGLTPIYHAAVNKHYEIVKILCQHGADPTILDKKNVSVLSKFSSDNDFEFVKLLLKKRCDPSVGDALKVSLELYHQEIVKLLIEAGTDVNKSSHVYCFLSQI